MGGRIVLLSGLCLVIMLLFLFVSKEPYSEYIFKNRLLEIAAIVSVALCIGVSTIIFQSFANNKILTPAIIGLDSLYLLIQSALIFSLGAASASVYKANINFTLSLLCMALFSLGLYKILFRNERSIYLIMLLGLIFGTLFGTVSSFFEVLIDPDEFLIIQGRIFASFDNLSLDLLGLALLFMLGCFGLVWRYFRFLDPLTLGRDLAINLGIDYQRITQKLMIIVALLTAISTALVGPITFLGLLVSNITYELFSTARHSILLPACALISIIALLGGVFFVSHTFVYDATVSVLINFIGGIYFIYLVLRGSRI